MGEERVHEYAWKLKVGDWITPSRWKIERISAKDGVISAVGRNANGTQFALCTKATREVMVWR